LFRRKQGMGAPKARQGGGFLVHFGIVLHGTGTQGIKAAVYRKVFSRKPGKVAYHRGFVQFGKRRFPSKQFPGKGRFFHLKPVKPHPPSAGDT
jgi:hypothetical protein